MKTSRISHQSGVIKKHPDGYGFVICDDTEHPDIFVPRRSMGTAMSNDYVEVSVVPEPGGDRFRGEVLQIIERKTSQIIGDVLQLNDGEFLIDEGERGWGEPLRLTNPNHIAEIKNGDWVVALIRSYPGSDQGFRGEIIQKIGDIGNPINDNARVLAEHSIPNEFSKPCIEQAKSFGSEVSEVDKKNRVDLRDLSLITIDGKTAKDFDDAIYVEQNESGFRLIVAIADVSHYVDVDSAIDRDAIVRGTSTYFPGFVSPMLPENLSNGLCSLNPNVDRLTFVCETQISYSGDILDKKIYEAVMSSKARLTYGEAQAIIDGAYLHQFERVKENVLLASQLAKILLSKRVRNGTLQLEIPEVIVEVDSNGMPTDLVQGNRIFAHQLIEELMLVANVSVAEFLAEKEIPLLYRVHEPPKEEAIIHLENYLETLGVSESIRGSSLQKKLSHALKQFKGTPQELVINILILRSMAQAKYSSDNVGHFGLGFSHYAHFTSPIRRYPDLVVHRILKSQIYQDSKYEKYNEEELITLGNVLSSCEQRSVKAERQIVSIKKARYMSQFVGESFPGIISSVTKFGVFVMIRQFGVDGLVKIEELPGDYYEFDEDHLTLTGRKNGLVYAIGDELEVTVTHADSELGQVDLGLGSEQKSKSKQNLKRNLKKDKSKKNKKSKKKSGKTDGKNTSKSSSGNNQKRGKAKKNSRRIRKKRVRKSC